MFHISPCSRDESAVHSNKIFLAKVSMVHAERVFGTNGCDDYLTFHGFWTLEDMTEP